MSSSQTFVPAVIPGLEPSTSPRRVSSSSHSHRSRSARFEQQDHFGLEDTARGRSKKRKVQVPKVYPPIDPNGPKTSAWTEEENVILDKMVEKYTRPNKDGVDKLVMDWTDVTRTLNRTRADVDRHFNRRRKANMIKGDYTPEEDALILQRVQEYKERDSIKGLWKDLEREMNRSTWSIGYRWTTVLAKQSNLAFSIEAFPDSSMTPVAAAAPAPRIIPSEPVPTVSAAASKFIVSIKHHSRAPIHADLPPPQLHPLYESIANTAPSTSSSGTRQHLEPPPAPEVAQTEKVAAPSSRKKRRWIEASEPVAYRTGSWSAEEVDHLMEYVAYQQCEYDKTQYTGRGEGKFKIDWGAIGEQLNRDKDVCCNKHKAVMRSKLKKGEFSPEENVIIVRRIEEWGQRGHGMWAAIGRELGRDGVVTHMHWKNNIRPQTPTIITAAEGEGGEAVGEGRDEDAAMDAVDGYQAGDAVGNGSGDTITSSSGAVVTAEQSAHQLVQNQHWPIQQQQQQQPYTSSETEIVLHSSAL